MKSKKSSLEIMLRLVTLVKPMIPIIVCAVIMGVLGFLCACAVPVLGAVGITGMLPLRQIIVLIICAAVLRGVLHYIEQASNHYIAFKLLAIIRSRVFGALRRLSPAKLECSEKGNLISLITSDVELLEVFYAHTISPIAIAILTSLVFVGFISSISPLLGLVSALAYIAVGVIIPVYNSRTVKQAGLDYRNAAGDMNTLFLESLRGIGELIQYGNVDSRKKAINAQTQELAALQLKLKGREAAVLNLTDRTVTAFNLAALAVAAVLCGNGTLAVDKAIVALTALYGSYGSVIALSNLSVSLAGTLASGERVLNLLDEQPVTKEKTDGADIKATDVDCQNVCFAYDKTPILKGVTLNVPKNGITGILGKSGCGKSTLLKLIMRFWDKDSGNIFLSGTEIKDINTDSLRQNESYCTQETYLFNISIEDNIRLARPTATRQEVEEAAKKASLHSFISTLPNGYDTVTGELGERLSGGERQRIGLARAFLSDANIMLLDEPTSNLDSLNEGIILKALKDTEDKTILLISHRMSTLGIADRVVKIENGRVVS